MKTILAAILVTIGMLTATQGLSAAPVADLIASITGVTLIIIGVDMWSKTNVLNEYVTE